MSNNNDNIIIDSFNYNGTSNCNSPSTITNINNNMFPVQGLGVVMMITIVDIMW